TRHILSAGPAEIRGRVLPPLLLFYLLPPIVVLSLCKGLSAPLFAQVPEVGWTRRNVWRQAVSGLLAVLFFLGLASAGIEALEAGHTRWAGLTLHVAAGGRLVGQVIWTLSRTSLPRL